MNVKNDILLINREDSFLETTCDSLKKAGYSVITAIDMRGALTALQSDAAVKLIICDNALKDVSGYEFLRYIKNDPIRDAIPFVFFVPVNDQGHAFKAFELGAKDFLVYPMDVKDFTDRIKSIMSPPDEPDQPTSEATQIRDIPEKYVSREKEYDTMEIQLDDQRQRDRLQPLPHLDIEVSRDGMLWMPGKIGDFSEEGMFLETSLLAKPGASLQIRISMSKNQYIINGEIKHLSFGSDSQSAGIGVENSGKGTIINNNCSNNAPLGIYISGSSNISIIENIVNSNNMDGIYLHNGCFNTTISYNIASSNIGVGIYLNNDCHHNLLFNNTLTFNLKNAIRFNDNCYNNTVIGNNASNNMSFTPASRTSDNAAA